MTEGTGDASHDELDASLSRTGLDPQPPLPHFTPMDQARHRSL